MNSLNKRFLSNLLQINLLLAFLLFSNISAADAQQDIANQSKPKNKFFAVNRSSINRISCKVASKKLPSISEKSKHFRFTDDCLIIHPRFSSRSSKNERKVEFSFDGMTIKENQWLSIKLHPGDMESKRRWIGLLVEDYEIRLKSHTVMLLGDGKRDDRKIGLGGFLLPPEIFDKELTAAIRVNEKTIQLRLDSAGMKKQLLSCQWTVRRNIKKDNTWKFGIGVYKGNKKIPPVKVFSLNSPAVVDGKLRPMPEHPLSRVTKDGIGIGKSGRQGMGTAIDQLQMSMDAQVTQAELTAAINHVLKVTLPGVKKHRLSFFGQRRECSSIGWLYRRTGDRRLIDGMIDATIGVISHRNDNYQKTKVLIGNPTTKKIDKVIAPNWEHLRKAVWDTATNDVYVEFGIGSFGGQAWPIMTARMIAETPQIWEKQYQGNVKQLQGKTYRQVGLVLLSESKVTLDFLMKYYLDPTDMLWKSPAGLEEPEGVYPQWNRIFPAMVANANFVVACRKFGIWKEYSDRIEQTVVASMKLFESRLRTHTRGRKTVYSYSYGSTSMTQCEDTGHGSFEHSELGWLFDEGYYKKKHAMIFADTVESLHLGGELFCPRFSMAEEIPKNQQGKKLYEKGIGYMWMTRFNPNLFEIICENATKNGKGLYAYCQVLKIRDHFSKSKEASQEPKASN